MAEQSDQSIKNLDSSNSREAPGVVLPSKSPEEGIPPGSELDFNKDLKSVLVTSVLSLETLDVDLYRYS